MNKPAKTSQIRINIGLDDKNVPSTMDWDADDSPNKGKPAACKAMLLSLFDKETLDTVKIDLWTTVTVASCEACLCFHISLYISMVTPLLSYLLHCMSPRQVCEECCHLGARDCCR